MSRPDLSRVPESFHRYIGKVNEDDLIQAFKNHSDSFVDFLNALPAEKRDFRYGPGKWSIKEMLHHINDAERIFGYRALCIARKETQSLPGFDENSYVDNAKTENRKWQDLIEEFNALRKANEIMFRGFDEEQIESSGISNQRSIYVKAIGFVIIGHVLHHKGVIEERYI